MAKITSFRGEYRWLSNFYELPRPFPLGGIKFTTTEHFYQAMKTTDHSLREAIAAHPSKGLKGYVRSIRIRNDWHDVREDVMLFALRLKFSHKLYPELSMKLIATGDTFIEENNEWGDVFWGICNGKGSNTLGKMLMQVREELK